MHRPHCTQHDFRVVLNAVVPLISVCVCFVCNVFFDNRLDEALRSREKERNRLPFTKRLFVQDSPDIRDPFKFYSKIILTDALKTHTRSCLKGVDVAGVRELLQKQRERDFKAAQPAHALEGMTDAEAHARYIKRDVQYARNARAEITQRRVKETTTPPIEDYTHATTDTTTTTTTTSSKALLQKDQHFTLQSEAAAPSTQRNNSAPSEKTQSVGTPTTTTPPSRDLQKHAPLDPPLAAALQIHSETELPEMCPTNDTTTTTTSKGLIQKEHACAHQSEAAAPSTQRNDSAPSSERTHSVNTTTTTPSREPLQRQKDFIPFSSCVDAAGCLNDSAIPGNIIPERSERAERTQSLKPMETAATPSPVAAGHPQNAVRRISLDKLTDVRDGGVVTTTTVLPCRVCGTIAQSAYTAFCTDCGFRLPRGMCGTPALGGLESGGSKSQSDVVMFGENLATESAARLLELYTNEAEVLGMCEVKSGDDTASIGSDVNLNLPTQAGIDFAESCNDIVRNSIHKAEEVEGTNTCNATPTLKLNQLCAASAASDDLQDTWHSGSRTVGSHASLSSPLANSARRGYRSGGGGGGGGGGVGIATQRPLPTQEPEPSNEDAVLIDNICSDEEIDTPINDLSRVCAGVKSLILEGEEGGGGEEDCTEKEEKLQGSVRICRSCGEGARSEDARFCSACGASLAESFREENKIASGGAPPLQCTPELHSKLTSNSKRETEIIEKEVIEEHHAQPSPQGLAPPPPPPPPESELLLDNRTIATPLAAIIECEFCSKGFSASRIARHIGVCGEQVFTRREVSTPDGDAVIVSSMGGDVFKEILQQGGEEEELCRIATPAGSRSTDGIPKPEEPDRTIATPLAAIIECEFCSKGFSASRIARHIGVCGEQVFTRRETPEKDVINSPAPEASSSSSPSSVHPSGHEGGGGAPPNKDVHLPPEEMVPCDWCVHSFPSSKIEEHSEACKIAAYEARGAAPPPALSANEEVQNNTKRIPCEWCPRSFAEDRIEKHAEICKKQALTKRGVFNAAKQRQIVDGVKKNPVVNVMNDANEKKPSNWRNKANALRSALRAARSNPKDPPTYTTEENDDRTPCPHCGRRFAANVAERHIPKCATMKSRPRPRPAGKKAVGQNDLEGSLLEIQETEDIVTARRREAEEGMAVVKANLQRKARERDAPWRPEGAGPPSKTSAFVENWKRKAEAKVQRCASCGYKAINSHSLESHLRTCRGSAVSSAIKQNSNTNTNTTPSSALEARVAALESLLKKDDALPEKEKEEKEKDTLSTTCDIRQALQMANQRVADLEAQLQQKEGAKKANVEGGGGGEVKGGNQGQPRGQRSQGERRKGGGGGGGGGGGTSGGLVPCQFCSRQFAPSVAQRHIQLCAKASIAESA